MPLFKLSGQMKSVWVSVERIISMESGPGGLTTIVQVLAPTGGGTIGLASLEVEGRIEMLAAVLDGARSTAEVGQ